jgi:hypothetical protein
MICIKALQAVVNLIEALASEAHTFLFNRAVAGLDKQEENFAKEALRHYARLEAEAARHLNKAIDIDCKVDYLHSIVGK